MDEELIEETPTKTYRVENGRVSGFIDEQEAMKQAIQKALATRRFAHAIYSENYGSDLEDLVGESLDLVKAELERIVSEALLIDDRVLLIENFSFTVLDKSSIAIHCEVATIFGQVALESEVQL
ncbi:DUF2634 domain-containing protein [Enterococcus olivae]